ncbi:MAG: RtcB family protein [Euryarchaeota archaeon]|nr:RtcB family protein [Euryarchaeota archaeon]
MAWDGPLEQVAKNIWEIPQDYTGQKGDLKMRVPGRIIADAALMETIREDNAPEQVANVAALPGIVGHSWAMPDIHWGYGFPIGGVAAMDAEEGVISPGGVGFDINCGVRLIRTDLKREDLRGKEKALVEELFKEVPCGLGSKARVRLTDRELEGPLTEGARWAVDQGYGWDADTEVMEEYGRIEGADTDKVSDKARKRGAPQVGSLGSGNHFLEIQKVGEILDTDIAKRFGFTEKDQLAIMVHTGSRGFGHQVCSDYLKTFEDNLDRHGIHLPDKQLACGPARSQESIDYLGAMHAAINFAFANRQMITHWTRNAFSKVLGRDAEEMGMRLVYDVAHNIVKRETHMVDGKKRDLYVHRKGATRAFGPGREEVPETYRDIGQPTIIPGSMGTGSYLLVGTERSMQTAFGSTCHGAGRKMSRSMAKKTWRGEALIKDLGKEDITVKADSPATAAEEAPGAYKDVMNVVHAAEEAGISNKVVLLRPVAVIKG